MEKNNGNQVLKLTKNICTVLAAVLAALCLTACGSAQLAEDFDEGTVKEMGQKAVDCLIAGEYEECVAMMDATMQAAVSAEVLASNVEAVKEKNGAFREYKSTAVVGQKDAEGEDCAVAVIVADFENGKVTCTVSFNKGMEVIGLWMK